MNVTIKVFASNVYLKQNHHTPSHGNAPLEKSTEHKEFNEFIITLKNYGNCFTRKVTVRNRYYNSKSWTALRDSKASYNVLWPFLCHAGSAHFNGVLIGPSWHCHLPAALYIPPGQTPLPLPRWPSVEVHPGLTLQSLTWRNHPQFQSASVWSDLLPGAAWTGNLRELHSHLAAP